ncbi:MAG: Fic family protein [Bacteroidia bacterium]
MEDIVTHTPGPMDNKLGITDANHLNEHEAKGLIKAELYTFDLDEDVEINAQLILEIHRIAFEDIYDWGGKWRQIEVKVGRIEPPTPVRIPMLMYQFLDNLNFKVRNAATFEEKVDCIAYAHYEYIKIHPFNNGNGRTGRILMNLVCLIFGYQPLVLYHRDGDSRKTYINALQTADDGDFSKLKVLIAEELESL